MTTQVVADLDTPAGCFHQLSSHDSHSERDAAIALGLRKSKKKSNRRAIHGSLESAPARDLSSVDLADTAAWRPVVRAAVAAVPAVAVAEVQLHAAAVAVAERDVPLAAVVEAADAPRLEAEVEAPGAPQEVEVEPPGALLPEAVVEVADAPRLEAEEPAAQGAEAEPPGALSPEPVV
jgi:hypothetical protein